MSSKRPNPWATPHRGTKKSRGRLGAMVAVALAIGVAIGLLVPTPHRDGGVEQPTAVELPSLPAREPARRTDSPLPLPPALPRDSGIAGDAASRLSFGFCRGREGDNCVIDGDSFVFRGEAVRLAGIDTPEIGSAQCEDERARGEAAERRLHALLNGGEVRLVRVGGRDRDRFGRLLRDAEVDGASVSERLLAEGHARRWTGQRQPWC